jgi:hypothetical protein
MTRAAAEIAHFVGWVERLVCGRSTSEGGIEIRHRPGRRFFDIASAFSLAAVVKSEGGEALKFRIVRLISSSMRISDSIRTSRHVRFALHVWSGSLPRAG